ncbi:hypothetical protein C8N35_11299 [Breoghania corrubedonensis]|uniref:Phytase-like domain-containing protein n=1 Tax=Breoghania corrubedonensis TaxID=665038 RepID=A0A2T5UWA1_9HYPH|nr:esterase-like activity of phytase family protein [Breoghania corrubedonensis]PTW55774.1 hypothetical protein C8N35_11299 [Breoghania corrubedonensis]
MSVRGVAGARSAASSRRAGAGWAAALAAAWLIVFAGPVLAKDRTTLAPGRHDLQMRFEPLPSFKLRDHERTRFGALKWLGGGVLSSPNPHMGGLSGLEGLDGGRRMLSISDNGLWFSFDLDIDGNGAPVGIGKAWVAPMLDKAGNPMIRKSEADSEGLALRPRAGGGNDYLVSFEGVPRIYAYHDETALPDTGQFPLPGDIRRHLGSNRGLEALAYATTGPLAGSTVAIGELDKLRDDRLPGWIFDAHGKRVSFSLLSSDNYAATDAAFLPGGDLLLLERRFNLAQGVGMRIRRFPAARLKGADGLEGKVLVEADLSYQIDNMEGLSVDVDEAGRVLLTVISDDNRSILQRTLLLRFELVESDGEAPRAKPVQ